MRNGDVVIDGVETFTIERSASEGGACELELLVGPGGGGPPAHEHEEPESFEVVEGALVLVVAGEERTLRVGDRHLIPPGCAHTFRNASKTERVRARVVHSGRFERLIDQIAAGGPTFLRISRYLHTVDPRAAYMVQPVVRWTMAAASVLARLLGVRIAPATGRYGRA